MSETEKTKLFFVKAPGYGLMATENFLSKRDFEIHSETVVAESIIKIIDLQPDFVFLDWDHPDQNIHTIPKIIAQACLSPIIPYILIGSRTAVRNLNMCPLHPKIYPPVSGPAIQRLIIKSYKKNAEEEAKYEAERKARALPPERIQQLREQVLTHIKSSESMAPVVLSESPEDADNADDEIPIEEFKAKRNDTISSKNSFLQRSKNLHLSQNAIDELKNSVDIKLKEPLESLLNTIQENARLFSEQNNATDETAQPSAGRIIQTGDANSPIGEIIIQKSEDAPIGSVIQTPDKDRGTGSVIIKSDTKKTEKTRLKMRTYCMSVYSDNWCGYLIITTQAELEFSTVDIIFTEWIKTQFENLQEADEFDYFEFTNIDFAVIDQLTKSADYSESLKVNDFDLKVFLFPVDPELMTLELTEDESLIKMQTEAVPVDTDLNFSLQIHLPENKKYILYTPAHKQLNNSQKERLLNNKIMTLYTPLNFEKEFKKFLAEKNVRHLYENMKKKFTSV